MQEDVGYSKLMGMLGVSMPTGAGGSISIVEARIPANDTGSYLVDVSSAEFNAAGDPNGVATTLTDGSFVTHVGFSGHATWVVGQYYFGNTQSFAPGANSVLNYEANHWLSSIMLVNGTAPPNSQPFRVQNHSWVGFGTTSAERSTLRRLDFVIDDDEMTTVVGTNNYNPAAPATWVHPTLLVQSYNVIVAGRTDGWHSRGQVSFYGAGRYRVDLVAPTNATSTSAARISSAAAMLQETAAGTDAARSEVIKATLMAGATKDEFVNWTDGPTGVVNPWDRTPTRPLDDIVGAGELNVYNSYLIQHGGKQSAKTSAPTAPVTAYGWDYQNRKADSAVGNLYYNFEIPAGSTASELSIMLVWNAKITDTDPNVNIFTPVESLQNLNLQFYNSTASFMGTLIDQSISTVDNVEHIYQKDLGPGTYTLKVTGAANWDYGLAWRTSTSFDQPNADFDGNGFVDGGDFLVWQRNFGTLINAANSDGDADGDGDVDGDDLGYFRAGAIAAPAMQLTAMRVAAIPEPAAAGALATGMLLCWLARRHSRSPRG